MTIQERINRKSKICDNGYIEWTGWIGNHGYGSIWMGEDDPKHLVHRLVWELVNGPIENGIQICHTCDNRKCINLDHLYYGTAKTNAKDRDSRGRSNWHVGSDIKSSKLKEEDVILIRKLSADKIISQSDIAKSFNISRHQVWMILSGRNWGWLNGE